MNGKRIIYYILAAFILGNFLLIYIQYNSAKNINALVDDNELLLEEFKAGSNLRELEKDILAVEDKMRGAVSNNIPDIEGLERKIDEVETDIRQLRGISSNDSSVIYINRLNGLVNEKMIFSKQVLNEYRVSGKDAAARAIARERGKQLTDSILITTERIDDIRHSLLASVTESTDENGKKALRFGTMLIVLVLVSGAALFWYIINTIRNQGQLIGQLNISEKKVKEAAAVKEKFLANMSHEIRTPLNAILGFTDLLQKKELDADTRSQVQTIQSSGQNLLSIVNDILDLSKIEAGMMRIESVPFSIRDTVQSVESMFRAKAEEKGVRFSFSVDESLPATLEGDPFRLTQVLVNLVGNSVKFTERGSISLQVSHGGQDGDTIKTMITVTDTGIGINKEKLDAIFQRFQQAEDSVTRSYGGTGLGLSIVKELVDMQGGTIEAQSETGNGTEFRLMIPFKEVMERDDIPAVTIEKNDQPLLQAAAILVVEDNGVNQLLMKQLLGNWHLSFDMAANGREAIDCLRRKNYSLVLMDIQMPEMDGYTATQYIRRQLKADVPIIAMTAHAFTGEKEKCLSYGMNDYISKPINGELLYRLIRQFIQDGAAAQHYYINLQYMKEVGNGNLEYEQLVTAQFMEMLPVALQELEQAWAQKDIPGLRRIAHNMKTTVSVMGLNDKLQVFLDALEYEPVDEEAFHKNYSSVQTICNGALKEAKQFYESLSAK